MSSPAGRPGGRIPAGQGGLAAQVAGLVLDVPDFPQPGITFKDLTPVFADPQVFRAVVGWVAELVGRHPVHAVAGIESRGFLLGAPAALELGVPFVPVRKSGKLPRAVIEESYQLEYGSATVAVHADALRPGARVLIVDDVLATGGTAAAAAALVERSGATVAGVAVLLELAALGGRRRLAPLAVDALLPG